MPETLGTGEYSSRLATAGFVMVAIVALIIIGCLVIAYINARIREFRYERKKLETARSSQTSVPEITIADVKLKSERLKYTEQLLHMIDQMIKWSTAYHFYKQLGKLPLDKFTGAMQETMISEVGKEVFGAIKATDLVSSSVVSLAYINAYIVNSTIIAVDATLSDLIRGEGVEPRIDGTL